MAELAKARSMQPYIYYTLLVRQPRTMAPEPPKSGPVTIGGSAVW